MERVQRGSLLMKWVTHQNVARVALNQRNGTFRSFHFIPLRPRTDSQRNSNAQNPPPSCAVTVRHGERLPRSQHRTCPANTGHFPASRRPRPRWTGPACTRCHALIAYASPAACRRLTFPGPAEEKNKARDWGRQEGPLRIHLCSLASASG